MKPLFALLTLLVLVSACSGPKTNMNTAVSSTNKAADTKPTANVSQAEMEVREKAVWEALEKKNYAGFADMLASDYLEVGDDGIFDKVALVNSLKDLNTTDATFADWKLLPINKDALFLFYSLTIKGTFKEQEIPPGPYRVSSAWVNREGKWLIVFYQQTAIKSQTAATAAPAARPSEPAKGAASPAGKIGDAGPDPIANEKLVWDAIKSKNADAFAAFLAPDAVEVEATAIYDKTASVKSVGMFDASKVELSDWKTVKFDADASLVTYVVKLPGTPRERHSTLWVNRNGKWAALFHQGTPEAKPVAGKQ